MDPTTATLVLFCGSVLLLLVAFVWAFKDVFARTVQIATEHVPAYGIVYIKCTVGMIIAAGICFKETWQPVTLAQTLSWAWWDWTIHLGAPILSMLLYLQAFLDRSMERAGQQKAKADATNAPAAQPPPAAPPVIV